ncbi:MAG: 5-formyltetrahydrofolate cyclo-ligase [Acidimicrobiia bacterium]|jgi:5-formyltetrahydrofolate cyclo-ligase|nr:5-formyltetrahydrofolate cyclo-ligase [Acidimicrobiia bacterium]
MIFSALPDECSLIELTTVPELSAHRWALPRIGPDRAMTAHVLQDDLELHRYGFHQPAEGAARLDERSIDIVAVPGVLFDRRGGRLGRGQGYYDRFLSRLRPAASLVGVTAEALVCESPLPVDDHDVPMGWLATERGMLPCPPAMPGS